MFITFSSDILYVLAMLKTTPLLVTIGISLTIPLAILGDFLLGIRSQPQALLGAALVFGGFIIVGFEDRGVVQDGSVVSQVLIEEREPILDNADEAFVETGDEVHERGRGMGPTAADHR
jgi:solute carrier family 35, member F5